MARHYYAVGRLGVLRKRWLLLALLALVAISMLIVLLMNSPFDSCDRACQVKRKAKVGPVVVSPGGGGLSMNPLGFMKSKLVLLVSHEMSLSGGPLLLMELAYMLRGVGAKVCWITVQVSSETADVVDNLEHKLLSRGVQLVKEISELGGTYTRHKYQLNMSFKEAFLWIAYEILKGDLFGSPLIQDWLAIDVWLLPNCPLPFSALTAFADTDFSKDFLIFSAKDQAAVGIALKADVVVLNTAVSGKWLDTLKNNVPHILPKVLWWIHEMRGHYFKLEYVKYLPMVAGAMIDSHVTAAYWRNRTQDRLRIKMPQTYVVHLGNSKDLMEVAESGVARRVLREHVRELLGVRQEDLLFGIINSVSRGKGQDLFLQAFHQSMLLMRKKKIQLPSIHAVIVGSDMSAQTKFESELRNLTRSKQIQNRVHFINKTLAVAPYLSAIDVLVQNSQARGECFGRITIEAMAFHLPVLGTAAGGTTEIVANGSTGLLHPVGKMGVIPLAKNMIKLATHVEQRLTMGRRGYERVKEMFLEVHMAQRISTVFSDVLGKSKNH